MNFSQRMGLTPPTKSLQVDDIDLDLRNGLWNMYRTWLLNPISSHSDYIVPFSNLLWHNYFKKPVDEIPFEFRKTILIVRDYFFNCTWYDLYNFIEFTLKIAKIEDFRLVIDLKRAHHAFNAVLEREFAGYRIIDGKIAPITNPAEISEIEEALSITNGFTAANSANIHLATALDKLSDRQNPDYRNSIKESVSAVEAIAKIISNDASDSLGEALNKIKGNLKIHSALEQGFKKIYGYTSDADGIRHSLTEDPNCDFEDAKFMLVSCSAFVNYLIVKAQKAGVTFSGIL